MAKSVTHIIASGIFAITLIFTSQAMAISADDAKELNQHCKAKAKTDNITGFALTKFMTMCTGPAKSAKTSKLPFEKHKMETPFM